MHVSALRCLECGKQKDAGSRLTSPDKPAAGFTSTNLTTAWSDHKRTALASAGTRSITARWGTADAETAVPSVEKLSVVVSVIIPRAGRNITVTTVSLRCHHQNDLRIEMGRDESHFIVSLIVRDKVTRQCPETTTFLKRRENRSGIEPRSLIIATAGPNRITNCLLIMMWGFMSSDVGLTY